MQENRKLQEAILRRLESEDYPVLFKSFSVHEVGGFEIDDTPRWSDEERYNLELLIERGMVLENRTKGDEPWLGEPFPDSPYAETYVRPSAKGHDYLSSLGLRGWLLVQFTALKSNVVTILVAVVGSLLTVWALDLFGPN